MCSDNASFHLLLLPSHLDIIIGQEGQIMRFYKKFESLEAFEPFEPFEPL